MSGQDSLVERLTTDAAYLEKVYGGATSHPIMKDIREAAAELSTLRSRCVELEAELDLFSDQSNNFQDRLMEAEAARDEAVRALEEIRRKVHAHNRGGGISLSLRKELRDIADAVLANFDQVQS